jgi:hypothetical protein
MGNGFQWIDASIDKLQRRGDCAVGGQRSRPDQSSSPVIEVKTDGFFKAQ